MDYKKQLLDWVNDQKNQGKTKEEITQILFDNNYNQDQIDETFKLLEPTSLLKGNETMDKLKKKNKQKTFIIIILIFIILALGSCFGIYFYLQNKDNNEEVEEDNQVKEESKEDFLQKVKDAVENKSGEDLMSLFYWENVDEETKDDMEKMLLETLIKDDKMLESIDFSQDIPEVSDDVINGVKYVPNLDIVGAIAIKMKNENENEEEFNLTGTTTLPYGKKDNKYYFTSVMKEISETSETIQDKQFQVMLMNYSSINKPEYKVDGYCEYILQSGQVKKEEWEKGGTKMFWAKEITKCEFTDLTGEYGVDVTISSAENNKEENMFKTIFEKTVNGGETIIINKEDLE